MSVCAHLAKCQVASFQQSPPGCLSFHFYHSSAANYFSSMLLRQMPVRRKVAGWAQFLVRHLFPFMLALFWYLNTTCTSLHTVPCTAIQGLPVAEGIDSWRAWQRAEKLWRGIYTHNLTLQANSEQTTRPAYSPVQCVCVISASMRRVGGSLCHHFAPLIIVLLQSASSADAFQTDWSRSWAACLCSERRTMLGRMVMAMYRFLEIIQLP